MRIVNNQLSVQTPQSRRKSSSPLSGTTNALEKSQDKPETVEGQGSDKISPSITHGTSLPFEEPDLVGNLNKLIASLEAMKAHQLQLKTEAENELNALRNREQDLKKELSSTKFENKEQQPIEWCEEVAIEKSRQDHLSLMQTFMTSMQKIVKLAELIDSSEDAEKEEQVAELPVNSVTNKKRLASLKLKTQLSEFFSDFISTYEDSPLVKTGVAKEIMNSLAVKH